MTDADTYTFHPRGLDPGKTYRVTFDSLASSAAVTGLSLIREGVPVRLENVGSSELLLFGPDEPPQPTPRPSRP